MIVNRKTVDPGDADSPPVLQLETAMGAAIDVFDGARAIRVGRERFAPVKTTATTCSRCARTPTSCTTTARIVVARAALAARRSSTSTRRYFKLVRDFDARFAAGAPSLVELRRR